MRKTFVPFCVLLVIVLLCVILHQDDCEPLLQIQARTNFTDRNECTTAIISGEVTQDGRPILWKNRDMNNPDQEFAYFEDGEYSYTTNIDAGDTLNAWGGVNSVGFAIENSTALNFPDTVAGRDDDGLIIKLALQTCRTVADFLAIMDSTDITGRTMPSNFGIIDAEGGAVIIEAASNDYTVLDVNNPDDAPDGFLVRANYSYRGNQNGRIGVWRHDRAYQLILDAATGDSLTVEFLHRYVMADLCLENVDPYPLPFDVIDDDLDMPLGFIPTNEAINRRTTRSVIIIQGVLEGENPLLSTIYATAGQPIFSVLIPLWVHSASVPEELDGDSTSIISDFAWKCVGEMYDSHLTFDALNTYQLLDGRGGGLLTVTQPATETILERTIGAIDEWRNELPEPGVISAFQNQQAQYVAEVLRGYTRPTLRRVPEDFDSIQVAIDISASGDTVLVAPGVYSGVVNFKGRDVIVASHFILNRDVTFIDSTILEGTEEGRSVALFRNGESRAAKLTGFTLQNASTGFGGGIYCNNGSPRLTYLVIKNNHSTRSGGAIYCTQGSNPILDHVTLVGNTADDLGGGIHCFNGTSVPVITNSIIRDNLPAALPDTMQVSYCNVEGGFQGDGNIDVDPMFVDFEIGNFHLSWDSFPVDDETKSLCIDAGSPFTTVDQDCTRADIGAFFFNQGLPQDIAVSHARLEFLDAEPGMMVSQSLIITNRGDRLLTVTAQTIETLEGPPFIFIDEGGGAFALAGADTHETVITFAPLILTEYEAVLYIISDDPYEEIIELPMSGRCLGVGDDAGNAPIEYGISTIYPNPVNSTAVIKFGLRKAGNVKFSLYNILGEEISAISDEFRSAGAGNISWQAEGIPTGIYFLKMVTIDEIFSSKIMIIK